MTGANSSLLDRLLLPHLFPTCTCRRSRCSQPAKMASSTRAVFRHANVLLRRPNLRNSSSTSTAANAAAEGAAKASASASTATSKASEGLSRVTSSAGPAISGAARGVGNALGRIGGRTGRIISKIECGLYLVHVRPHTGSRPQRSWCPTRYLGASQFGKNRAPSDDIQLVVAAILHGFLTESTVADNVPQQL